jgi:hypothetical protein
MRAREYGEPLIEKRPCEIGWACYDKPGRIHLRVSRIHALSSLAQSKVPPGMWLEFVLRDLQRCEAI